MFQILLCTLCVMSRCDTPATNDQQTDVETFLPNALPIFKEIDFIVPAFLDSKTDNSVNEEILGNADAEKDEKNGFQSRRQAFQRKLSHRHRADMGDATSELHRHGFRRHHPFRKNRLRKLQHGQNYWEGKRQEDAELMVRFEVTDKDGCKNNVTLPARSCGSEEGRRCYNIDRGKMGQLLTTLLQPFLHTGPESFQMCISTPCGNQERTEQNTESEQILTMNVKGAGTCDFPKCLSLLDFEPATPAPSRPHTTIRPIFEDDGSECCQMDKEMQSRPLDTSASGSTSAGAIDLYELERRLSDALGTPECCRRTRLSGWRGGLEYRRLREHLNPREHFPRKNEEPSVEDLGRLQEGSTTEEVRDFVQKASHLWELEAQKNALAQWEYETNITEETRDRAVEVSVEQARFQRRVWEALRDFDASSLNDSALARQLAFLGDVGTAALSDAEYQQLDGLVSDMESVYSTATVCTANGSVCGLALEPDLTQLMSQSRDPVELSHAWQAWRDATGRLMRYSFQRYVRLLNRAAELNSMDSAVELWLSAYEDAEVERSAQALWHRVRPLYLQLHAYVRRKLRERYGEELVSLDGPLPAHLLGNMWGQSWTNIYNLTVPYPFKKTPDVTTTMKKKGYTPMKLFKTSESFFVSLGLSPMSRVFWEKSILERPPDNRSMVCHASAWDMFFDNDFR